MKIHDLLLGAGVVAALTACASSPGKTTQPKHRIVMEVSTDDPKAWEAALNNIENLRNALGAGASTVELVAHGGGLGMLLGTNSAQSQRMEKLAAGGVVFAACENTMKRKKVTRDDLLPFVTTVDSGVAEVVRKQEQGWSYVKAGF
ncbi:MAG: DsrE family protein [Thermoanaerobaculia bacterium]